jgi:O-antigen ligase
MSYESRRELRDLATSRLGRWPVLAGGAILLGLLSGALAERKPSMALLICLAIAGLLGLAMLGERAFPWAIVIVAVTPWYPFLSENAEPPIVRQKVFCAVIAAAVLAPWLWSLAIGGRRTRSSPGALLMGVLFAGLAILIYQSLGSTSSLIDAKIVGFLFIGLTFLCARRFGAGDGWLAAAFGGLALLALMGADAYVKAPSARIGAFSGYPITYGALVVGLLPAALLFSYRQSRLLAAGVAMGSAVLLIFSQSRSSWIAVGVVVMVVLLLQARAANFRALAAVATILIILTAVIAGNGSLHHVITQKINSKTSSSQSVTHREFSYGYAAHQVSQNPVFGAGAPGFSAEQSANSTSIGALDNGYLSISVDMGLVGLFAAIIPIAVALRALERCLRFGVTPQLELALALGVLGMAVVTIFYDSFYWAQIDLLMGAMAGVLSTRLSSIVRGAPAARPKSRRRRMRVKLAV